MAPADGFEKESQEGVENLEGLALSLAEQLLKELLGLFLEDGFGVGRSCRR